MELQLILEDFSETIREVQRRMLEEQRCEKVEKGLSEKELLAVENRSLENPRMF